MQHSQAIENCGDLLTVKEAVWIISKANALRPVQCPHRLDCNGYNRGLILLSSPGSQQEKKQQGPLSVVRTLGALLLLGALP